MLALDSHRWCELNHAYGPATDVPALIRAIANEPFPRYSDHPADARNNPTPWDEVYASLCHQYSIYSATYAALPHIVEIAEAGGLEQRVETLLLAGTIRVNGVADPDIPTDLIGEFEIAMAKVRTWSLATVKSAKLDNHAALPCLLQAFGGLRHPKSVYVRAVEHFYEGDCELEIDYCPNCREYFAVEITTDGPVTLPSDSRGKPIRRRAKKLPVDRSSHATRSESGRLVLQQSDDPDWPKPETGNVLAALALEREASVLATRILDIDSMIACPHCDALSKLAETLDY